MNKHSIQPIKRRSFRDEVYQTLKKAIITLEFEPGQRLNDNDLAEKFGVSRTPVREALKRLEDEGLVEAVPGSITRVTPLKLEEGNHAFTVVAVLHALAARLAVPLLTNSDIEALERSNRLLQQSIQNNNILDSIEADDSFHNVFLNTAANPEIRIALKGIVPKIHRMVISQFASTNGLQSVEQHQKIILACRNKETEKVARFVEENWLSLGSFID